ncbi:MAG TPA: OsmC family protein [Solirubrobacterales bacterium]|nr:OsmC family protein [Solirubrobacterales bacterium]
MSRTVATKGEGLINIAETDTGRSLTFDASEAAGGTGSGFTPTEAVSASLAACTAMTVEMYAGRKGWDVEGIRVQVDTEYDGPKPSNFKVSLELPGHLDTEQKERLRVVAHKCPVHRLLIESVPVETICR